MGRNFYDYPGFQPKITWIKHFCPESTTAFCENSTIATAILNA
jgi:hypothetical protein